MMMDLKRYGLPPVLNRAYLAFLPSLLERKNALFCVVFPQNEVHHFVLRIIKTAINWPLCDD